MRLIRLKLSNFRQHQETVIDFQDGMTAIVGPNGAGKSTLLEAVMFALYGHQRDTKETIRFYWNDSKRYSVTLEFEFNGRRYGVERSSTDSKLEDITDKIKSLATGLAEVPRACERLLCLTHRQFKNSFCAEQKELAFLNFPAAMRQEEVARMLGMDRLKSAEEMAKERRANYRIKVEALERTLGNLQDIEREKKDAEVRLKGIEEGLGKLKDALEKLQQKIGPAAELRKVAERWNELTAEMNVISGEASALKEAVRIAEVALNEAKRDSLELEKLKPSIEAYNRFEAEAKHWDEMREAGHEKELLTAEWTRLTKEVGDLKTRAQALSTLDVAAIDKRVVEVEKALEQAQLALKRTEGSWQTSKSAAEAKLATSLAMVSQAEIEMGKSQNMLQQGKCPECGQPIRGDYKHHVERAIALVKQRMAERDAAQKTVDECSVKPKPVQEAEMEVVRQSTELQKLQADRSKAIAEQAQVSTLREEIAGKEPRVKELKEQIDKMPFKYSKTSHASAQAELERHKPAYHRSIQLQNSVAKLGACEKQHKSALNHMESAKERFWKSERERKGLAIKTQAEAAEAVSSHQKLLDETRDHEAKVKHQEELRTYAQRERDQATQRLNEYEAKAKELAETRTALVVHDVTAKELRSLRESLNRTIRPDLAARASETLSLLTGGRYPVLELDDSFEPTVVEDGIRKPVISGGEEDVVALALRLALSELIQEWNGRPMALLILDEVFGSLDVERRQSVLDRLAALKGRFRQILVISHIEEINQVADQCLYLTRDADTRATLVTDAPGTPAELVLV